MPKLTLTHSSALLAQCETGKRKTDFYDDTVTGFVLECRSTGGKTYYLRYDQAGRQKQHKIGRYDDVTFAAAKKAAQRLRSEVVMGGDPGARKAEAKAVPMYSELAAQHLADAKLHQRSYDTTEGYMRLHIMPKWAKVRLTDIDGRAVAHWLADKRAEGLAPATVVKIKAIFGRSFELGARWGVPGCERNPVRGVQSKPLNNARERYLTSAEATRLLAAAEKSRNPQPATRGCGRSTAAHRNAGVGTAVDPLGARGRRTAHTARADLEDGAVSTCALGAGGGGHRRTPAEGDRRGVPVSELKGLGEASDDDQARMADRAGYCRPTGTPHPRSSPLCGLVHGQLRRGSLRDR